MVKKKSVLMSIRPEYAEAILSGEKTVELRRRRPSFPPGTRVLIYSSAPDQKLLGTFEVGAIHEASPQGLWRKVAKRAGVDHETYETYFEGCQTAYGIEARSVRRLKPRQLRIRPPQSYFFLRPDRRAHRPVLRWAAST
jgi:predicted transcriptional regulator